MTDKDGSEAAALKILEKLDIILKVYLCCYVCHMCVCICQYSCKCVRVCMRLCLCERSSKKILINHLLQHLLCQYHVVVIWSETAISYIPTSYPDYENKRVCDSIHLNTILILIIFICFKHT